MLQKIKACKENIYVIVILSWNTKKVKKFYFIFKSS